MRRRLRAAERCRLLFRDASLQARGHATIGAGNRRKLLVSRWLCCLLRAGCLSGSKLQLLDEVLGRVCVSENRVATFLDFYESEISFSFGL